MTIQCDSREHKFEIARIQRQIEREGVHTFIAKLDVGDYMNVDNPKLIIDRKKDLQEICGNITHQHSRFQRELIRAMKQGVQLIILIEHGPDIMSLEDIWFWENPRLEKSPRATTGKTLYKAMLTMQQEYGLRYEFCTRRETGKKIVELLRGDGR